MNRLTCESESGGVTLSYTYDGAGNRSSLTATGTEAYTTACVYDLNNRLLSETKTAGGVTEAKSYSYDANGNQLGQIAGLNILTYAYDLFYFQEMGYHVDTLFASDTTMYSEFDAAFESATTVILSFYNYAEKMSIHTISISHDGNGGLIAYNLYTKYEDVIAADSFYDLFEKNHLTGAPIVLYLI